MTSFVGRLARPFLVEPQEILQLSQSARALGSCAEDALSCLKRCARKRSNPMRSACNAGRTVDHSPLTVKQRKPSPPII